MSGPSALTIARGGTTTSTCEDVVASQQPEEKHDSLSLEKKEKGGCVD